MHGEVCGPDPNAAPRRNRFAIASLVFGLLWLFFWGSILALIFGCIGLLQIRRSQGRQIGRGMAIAGIVLGSLELVLLIIVALAASHMSVTVG